jgi:hypothetical protein
METTLSKKSDENSPIRLLHSREKNLKNNFLNIKNRRKFLKDTEAGWNVKGQASFVVIIYLTVNIKQFSYVNFFIIESCRHY